MLAGCASDGLPLNSNCTQDALCCSQSCQVTVLNYVDNNFEEDGVQPSCECAVTRRCPRVIAVLGKPQRTHVMCGPHGVGRLAPPATAMCELTCFVHRRAGVGA